MSSPRAIERNDRATTTPHRMTARQTFGDFARIPAHSHPRRENIPIPTTMGAIHKEFTSFHVNGFWSTRTSILSSVKVHALPGGRGCRIVAMSALDMFPHTHHFETIAVLEGA